MISIEDAMEALESMDEFARMEASVDPHGPYSVLKQFILERAGESFREEPERSGNA